MLYYFVRPIATLGIRCFFRRIFILHEERIPKDKPVVLAVNHPTAFLEPCILACTLHRPLYFLVRGDFFSKPLFDFLLRALHMLPIFRKRDKGLRAVKDNYATFEACNEALAENRTITILAEGSTAYQKRLRPLKKGLSRLAFGALDSGKGVEEVYIVPLGVTFTNAARFRSEVILSAGEAVPVSSYARSEHAKQAVAALNEKVYGSLSSNMVIIEDPQDDPLAEGFLEIQRNELRDRRRGFLREGRERLQYEQGVMRSLAKTPAQEKSALRTQWKTYRQLLADHGLTDFAVMESRPNRPAETLPILLGAPIYALGWLLNSWPLYFTEWLVLTRVPVLEFKLAIRVSVGIFAWLFWWLGVWGVAALAGGPFWIPLFLLPLTGWIMIPYTDAYRAWRERRRWSRLGAAARRELKARRSGLLEAFPFYSSSSPGNAS